MYITLDLGQLDPSLIPNATSYKLVGLESPTPFLQVGGSTFKGDYETLIGTEIILQDSPQAGTPASSRILQPVGMTSNRIRFKEVQLIPKTFPGRNSGVGEDGNDEIRTSDIRNKTLGGVSREKTATFFPIASREAGVIQPPARGKRRWHKRPEGYHTDEDEDQGKSKSGSTPNEANGMTEGNTTNAGQGNEDVNIEADRDKVTR